LSASPLVVGKLYIVATPIGNLADITLRALEVLKQVDVIAAEDTRHSGRLLSHYGVGTSVLSLHNYNEQARSEQIIGRLLKGESVALISDAGTPLVSDPGYRLVSLAHENAVEVVPIPGACAAIAGLVTSGMPTDRFVFEGFLPAKGEKRKQRLLRLADESRTIILYESVHRIMNLLDLMVEVFTEDRPLSIARELTKNFETIYFGTAASVRERLTQASSEQRGEFVVVVQGVAQKKTDDDDQEARRVLTILLEELPLKQSVKLAVEITGGRRKALYQLALILAGK
jgi:16S rRNA (cytidine1402-2'-O)-methyltransferase